MLNDISKQINTELQKEQDRKDFYDIVHEDVEFDNFIDDKFLNLNENGVNNKMLKNEMPFLFMEDTVVDDELVTNLQNEVDYEDNYKNNPAADSDETTDLQEPCDYDDNFDVKYASDVEVDTDLAKETDYSDNQTTPVNIDEFSNEAADILIEMGMFDLLTEDECDMTVPNEVDCPDEGETIPQADEANVADTEYPDMPEGVVMEEDTNDLLEDYFGLFEDADSDAEDDDAEDEDDDNDDDDAEDDASDEDIADESFDILGYFN